MTHRELIEDFHREPTPLKAVRLAVADHKCRHPGLTLVDWEYVEALERAALLLAAMPATNPATQPYEDQVMAMKELLRVEMTPAQVREACAAWAGDRTRWEGGADIEVQGIPDDIRALVAFRKKRAPRKPRGNGVASAGGLSPAEERFG